MPNHEIDDWSKIVIMACAPVMGNRATAKRANVSVWSVRKYKRKMIEQHGALDVDVSKEGMEILDKIVEEAIEQERGGI